LISDIFSIYDPYIGKKKNEIETIQCKKPKIWYVIAKAEATDGVSLFMSYDNRQSLKGFNSNSLYGEAYHQMFMLQIKEKIQDATIATTVYILNPVCSLQFLPSLYNPICNLQCAV